MTPGRTRFRPLRTILIAVIAVSALVLAGCSVGAPAATRPETGPVRGGNLNVAVPEDPQSLDMVANPGQVTQQISNMMYEKLFEVDRNFVARPMLVDTYSVSPDRRTYTFHLRRGVTFQDNKPLTSTDVVASLRRWLARHETGQLVARDVDRLVATDPLTVTLHLRRPRYPLIDELASPGSEIYEARNLAGVSAAGFGPAKAIGTGPYRLKSWDVGKQIVLERYPGYASRTENWGGQAGAKHAYLDTVTYKVVSDQNALLSGLQTGQWDHAMPTNDQYQKVRHTPGIVTANLAGGNENVLVPNFHQGSVFADPRARRALNMLIDKPAINRVTGGGPTLTENTGSFASRDNKALHSTAGEDIYRRHDPATAARLFAEAGVKPGDTVRIVASTNYPEFQKWAILIQDQLSRIGIDADVRTYDFTTMLGVLKNNPGGWDLTTLFFNSALTSPAQMPALTLGALSGATIPELQELRSRYDAASSPQEAKAVVDDLQRVIWEQLPVITLSQSRLYAAYSPRLKGYGRFYRIFWNTWLQP